MHEQRKALEQNTAAEGKARKEKIHVYHE